ncbi:MAG: hypothetical protein P0Y49_09840 [Candidatus Pedobacter colombiensis]|uniref:Uncharacterized protein n=1 Tax=Candidatus Pedobacter colombiensis TaxID=3121371 RepID=A0AAJ6BAN7_9SPHI|nr:hypothetical protein [Pedobacter sp.]WEK21438.1 MAG: hypothetical protein P0Y49_09840 [Pedobacter sp.]
MKTKSKTPKSIGAEKTKASRRPNYYFHADEDFREDRDWKKGSSFDDTTQNVKKKIESENSSKVC